MSDLRTDAKILSVSQELLASDGLGAVSFDAIARELGLSKQAVLYWFPSKGDLLAAMFVDWLGAEAHEAERSLESADTANEAVELFVRAITRFHMGDLDRFRMMYLAPQMLKTGVQEAKNTDALERIHSTTSRMYGAFAAHLGGPLEQSRQSAFAIHSAALGLIMMFGLSEGIGDPLKHSEDDLVTALIAKLSN
ncbi:MAG: TetR/AcrR family transcriptional regulator [Roseobacter sp.]|uniref:TetR/AcrR family transcriptional regulator n=1 Tax=Tateyamaria sp. TaxID=1929288 RepID=UPI0032928CCC